MKEEFEVLEVDFNPLIQKNVWKIKHKDGVIEIKELPVFIDRCSVCGDWINKKKANVCPLGTNKNDCCDFCAEKCRKEACCLLK